MSTHSTYFHEEIRKIRIFFFIGIKYLIWSYANYKLYCSQIETENSISDDAKWFSKSKVHVYS